MFDELFDDGGHARADGVALAAELERLGPERLLAAGRLRDAIFMQQGITFDATGNDGAVHDRPFPLDLVPRVIPAAEWRHIKRGLA
ncbi:MAG TPA: circularly permuted type 2 ATP-grasp protein, partial [Solirubrobacteraceae bacterium]|nr:circularly permuted type 2 ATP-grasp protein [Solirubrobacteraceae bacterium]